MNCPKCKVPMLPGKAMQSTWVGSPDFPGQDGTEHECTMNAGGPGKLINCIKCPECGYSIDGELDHDWI